MRHIMQSIFVLDLTLFLQLLPSAVVWVLEPRELKKITIVGMRERAEREQRESRESVCV